MAGDQEQRREGEGAAESRPRSSDADVARYRGERGRATADAKPPADKMARPGTVRAYETK
ncbi:hypothetical protein LOK46_13520 [Methylobacterium sp. NMS14P]|uniref:hypothetical protein n=1 Tax=Methylobacterium sp. NMS14P TaxID=2894310 RepID=UPI002359FA82|nr:hypothetical protein [Methylobacterium sp. NMS14P]WCS27794.1 hypothetical protein LOK46_13520 [Methylobacterium sp. NMS14P]